MILRFAPIFIFLLLVGCQEDKLPKVDLDPDTKLETKKNVSTVTDLSEEGLRNYFTHFLNKKADNLLKDEDFKFYRGQMNRDTILDWVVTVNTFEYAKKTLTATQNLMPIDYGYLGNYNHIFVVDGKTGAWNGRPIGSSATTHLEIEIDYINSEQYQLAKVFFRIGTSKFIAIYNSSIPSFQEIFNWEVFNLSDQKNQGLPTGNIIEFVGPPKGKKDILVYEASFAGFNNEDFVENMFTYEPQLKKSTKEPKHHFEYQLTEGKYGELKK